VNDPLNIARDPGACGSILAISSIKVRNPPDAMLSPHPLAICSARRLVARQRAW
jgi:hypothetical protein